MIDIIIIFNEPYFKVLEELLEYNTDTSAGHPMKDDDIVRYSSEKKRVNDKEH